MQSWEANSFGANEGADSLCVSAEANHITLAPDDGVHVSVHLSVDKGNVKRKV